MKYKIIMLSGTEFVIELNKTFKELMTFKNDNENLYVGEELFLSSKYIESIEVLE